MVIIASVDQNDQSSQIVREADEIGEAFDEDIIIIHVMTRSDFIDMEIESMTETGDTIPVDQIRAKAKKVAEDVAASEDVDAESYGLYGDPADKIVEFAENRDARYVVLSTRKKSPAGKALFGSVAQSVILSTDCPVVVV